MAVSSLNGIDEERQKCPENVTGHFVSRESRYNADFNIYKIALTGFLSIKLMQNYINFCKLYKV